MSDIVDKIRKRKEKEIKKKKVPVQSYPNSIERRYHRKLNNLSTDIKNKIKEYLLPEIPGMIEEVELKMPKMLSSTSQRGMMI